MSRLKQTQELKQTLKPQQVLQANILQLTSTNLEQRILQELEENPALEMMELEEIPEEEFDDPENNEDEETEFEWDDLLGDDYDSGMPREKPKEIQEIPIKSEKTIFEYLSEQIRDLNLTNDELEIAEQVIGNIDDDGYLSVEPVLISDRLGFSESVVLSVLNIIQKLDPPGMGSRNLQECLMAQVEEKKVDPLVWDILEKHFDDFANHRYQNIITNLHCTKDDLREAMETIASLNPKPGAGIENIEKDVVIPDIIVEDVDGEWSITINDSSIPELRISRNYKKMFIEHNNEPEVKSFVKKKLDSAKWFIDAINQRHRTMAAVMETIIHHQPKFFRYEKRELLPMVLKDIAEDINMDISTISRVTNGKYVQLPFGIFELKSFFSEGVEMKSGKMVSNITVKRKIQEIIESEDKHNPYGDEQLTQILNEDGYKIARRTVTKYRENLKIPIGRLRKEL